MFASDDSEGYDEDYVEGEDSSEVAASMTASMSAQGDFKQDAEMQALPLPNYSAEEILKEEMGSQQFREEQRAKANAAKVERDW